MKDRKLYPYIGPEAPLQKCHEVVRIQVCLPVHITDWIRDTEQQFAPDNTVTATFIVDAVGALWMADRHAEHVACARGEPVCAAGEVTFQVEGDRVKVVNVTNQSTGYVPESRSWPAVKRVLELIGIDHPDSFDPVYEFRRCDGCGTVNIIKDDWFVCSACEHDLSVDWNFD